MLDLEARRFCARLQALWPNGRWSALDEWRQQFLAVDAGLADRTLDRLRDTHREQPSIALWRETYGGIARGQAKEAKPEKWEGPTDAARAVVARIKADLAARARPIRAGIPWGTARQEGPPT